MLRNGQHFDLVVAGCALSATLFVLELFQSETTLRTGFIPWAITTLAVSYGLAGRRSCQV